MSHAGICSRTPGTIAGGLEARGQRGSHQHCVVRYEGLVLSGAAARLWQTPAELLVGRESRARGLYSKDALHRRDADHTARQQAAVLSALRLTQPDRESSSLEHPSPTSHRRSIPQMQTELAVAPEAEHQQLKLQTCSYPGNWQPETWPCNTCRSSIDCILTSASTPLGWRLEPRVQRENCKILPRSTMRV